MTEKRWEFRLDGIRHVVELEHGYFSGKRTIRVDGRLLPMSPVESQQYMDLGSRHPFQLGEHTCAVVILTNGITFTYDLEIDGASLTTGQSTDISESQKGAFASSRWSVGVFLILLGLGAGWANWHWAHKFGFYYEEIAFITPMPIILAIYFMLFPGDYVDQFNGKFSYRFWVAAALVILLGFANSYALGNGLY